MKYFEVKEKDQRDYNKYKKIRGEPLYEFIAKHCCEVLKTSKVDYCLIQTIIIYEKRLKYNLYKFFGTLEDYLKAEIYSKTIYDGKKFLKQKNDINNQDYFSAFNQINWGKYLFGDITRIAQENELIGGEIDWDKIRKLRNKVMHFNFLLFGENKEEGKYDLLTLKEIILFLKNSLPEKYGNSLIVVINGSKNKLDEFILKKYSEFFLEEIK